MAEPFTDSDAAIGAAVAAAHVPSLLAALVHLTGSADHLDGFPLPVNDPSNIGDEQGGLPLERQAAARDLAVAALKHWRDDGCPPLPRPSVATVRRAMNYVAGGQVPETYEVFLTEELHLDGNPRAVAVMIDAPDVEKAAFPVVIVGAGMSGLLAGIAMRQLGLPFTIVEARDRVGGTWWANRYPGARVDTPNHLYSYSFEPNHEWPFRYSPQPVLQDYFERIADKHGLRDHMRFETSVDHAEWDGTRWQVHVAGPAGRETLAARAFIAATGQLNRPKLPDLPGVGSFAGPAFHTAQWREDIDLRDKRVAVIGTGASAFQVIPEIAPAAAWVSVFQRTPPWVLPQPVYHDRVAAGKQWLLRHMPFYSNWFRFSLFWSLTEFLLPAVTAEDGWTGEGSISELNAGVRMLLEGAIGEQLADRPDLLARVIPDYPPGGKRMLVDNGSWAKTLVRDNVELIDAPIAAIVPQGVRLETGRTIEADALIYATGFHASEFLMPMRITGAGGRDLRATWDGEARAYYGMTVPDFPNFFMIYGPNTNIVVNGSIVFFSECSVNYISGCLKYLVENDAVALEPRPAVVDAFNARIDAANARMAWGMPGVSSWYKSASGRVSQNWPFALVDYWNATRAPDIADFTVRHGRSRDD